MPDDILDDDDKTLNSSDSAALDGTQDQNFDNEGQDQGADGAASSDAHGDNAAEPTTLDLVRDVVRPKGEDGAASPADGQEGKDPKAEGKDTKEPDDEEYSDVPFHKHPRFQHLLRAKKAAEGDAGRYQNVQKFMDNNGLTNEEVADGFITMALLKTDPVKAWARIKPIVQNLLVAAGEVLSPELQARVDSQELTAEAAAELAKANARVQTVENGRTFEQQRADRQRSQQLSTELQGTAVKWCEDRSVKDPNFEAKWPLLQTEIKRLQDSGWKPTTPEGVKEQLEAAYAKVVPPAARKSVKPAPTVGQGAAARRPTGSSGASGTATPQPQSTLDIIRAEVGKRQG